MLSLQKWQPGDTATTSARLAPDGRIAFNWSKRSPFSTIGGGACDGCGDKNSLHLIKPIGISTTIAATATTMMAMLAAVSSRLFFGVSESMRFFSRQARVAQ